MTYAVALGVLAFILSFFAWLAVYARKCAQARWTILVSPGAGRGNQR